LLALDRDALDALLALDAARAHEGPTRMVNCGGSRRRSRRQVVANQRCGALELALRETDA
jgi:hypothetical protein